MTNDGSKIPFADSPVELDLDRLGGDRLTRDIARSWRGLVGDPDGRPTLIACSGGADSVTLAAALCAASRRQRRPVRLAVAHVVHDMRPAEEAMRDRDLVRGIAEGLSVEFFEASIELDRAKNAEASAREKRYDVLGEIVTREGLPFVATAHHSNDQLETVLMALLRGTGPAGLRGISASRPLCAGVTLIRPMLGCTRREIERFAREHRIPWADDRTNADTARTRAALRHGPIVDLLDLWPDAPMRVSRTAELLADVNDMVEARAMALRGEGLSWPRGALAAEPRLVVGALLRNATEKFAAGEGRDAMVGNVIDPVLEAIRDGSGETRSFDWPLGIRVRVTKDRVDMSRAYKKRTPEECVGVGLGHRSVSS